MRICDRIEANHVHQDTTVQVDFDGTLIDNNGSHDMTGEPIASGVELVKKLHALGYRVIILTANPAPDVVGQWLVRHGVPFTAVTSQKMPAVAYVDDRAVPFNKHMPVSSILNRITELANG